MSLFDTIDWPEPAAVLHVMRLFKMLAFLVAVTFAAGAGGQTPPSSSKPSAEEVATALQRKYDSIRDFSTDFVHEYEGGVLKRKRVERGTLLVKKPGKMRWTYKSPDEKLFVSDGVRLWQHFPEENRVVVSAVPQDDKVATAVLFLVGKGNLTRDFRVSLTDKGDAGTWALRLDPKEPQAEYDWLEITRRPGHARASVPDGCRETGRAFDLPFHEFQGKRRTGR